MNPLTSYIHKEKKRGFSDSIISEKLKTAGYTDKEIQTAFHEFYAREQYHKFIDTIVEEETKHKWLFLVLCIFAIIIASAIFIILMQTIQWNLIFENALNDAETVNIEPQTEQDCSIFGNRDKERCILKIAALYDDTNYCINMTSKVMNYECKTEVWKKNYCNYLILTNQSLGYC